MALFTWDDSLTFHIEIMAPQQNLWVNLGMGRSPSE